MAPDDYLEKGHRIFIIITHVSPRFPINFRWPYLSPCAGSHIEARRVRPIGRRSRSGHWNRTKRVAPPQVQGGMAQTSRDSPAAVIPQAVTPRTRRAGRSGTHKAHARGGAGAGEPPPIRWECAGIQCEATHRAVHVWCGFSLNPVADK